MDITFNCDKCGHSIQIDEACAGLVMKCVKCLASVVIPSPMLQPLTAPERIAVPPRTESAPPRQRLKLVGTAAAATLVVAAVGLTLLGLLPPRPKPAALAPSPSFVTNLPAPAPPLPPVAVVTESPQTRFSRTARAVVGDLKNLDRVLGPGTNLEQYTEKLAAIADRIDALLAAAEETGMYEADPGARELCVTTMAWFFDHKQALNQWNLEDLLQVQLEELNSVPVAAGDLIDPLKERKATLTAKAGAAQKARAELWVHATDLTGKADSLAAGLGGPKP